MLFGTFREIVRILVVGVLAYAGLVLLLRVAGKRTLSKLNAFDLVVTVALGSTLATTLTSRDLPLANGLVALAVLIALQFVVAWLAVRLRTVRRVVQSDPTLLFHGGRHLEEAMREQRVTREELLAAARGAGHGDLSRVASIVLETDGSLSVLAKELSERRPDG